MKVGVLQGGRQARMTHDFLEEKNIAPINNELGAEGVTKQVWMQFYAVESGLLCQPSHELLNTVNGYRRAI